MKLYGTPALLAIVGMASLGAVDVDPRPLLRVEPTALMVAASDVSELQSLDELRRLTGPNTYLTSAAIAPWDPARIVVSTTFHGLYESRDGGRTWAELGNAPPFDGLYLGSGFFDDIAAVGYDPLEHTVLWVERAQSGSIEAIVRAGGGMTVEQSDLLTTERGRQALQATVRARQPDPVPSDPARRARRRLAADHVSFYLNAFQMEPEQLERHLEFAAAHGFTAIVVDFKDDNGRITYDSRVPMAAEVGSVRGYFDARRVIDRIQEAGLYLIARVVVFKDRELFAHDGHRYALWDSRTGRAWGVFREETNDETGETTVRQVEHWVDPFAEPVWDYNIAIAQELEALGVDEIQFDYIRTPADGRTWDIDYRFRPQSPAMADDDPFTDDRVQALSMFLERARSALSVPIGIDVFGFNGWYRMSYLGQDIGMLARHVDVISPMFYPSHFPREFHADLPYLEWAEFIYREGVARARRIAGDGVLIRPYVQAFLIGGELRFEEPTYTDYLKRQIAGSEAGGASGFTLWNFSGRYYMVSRGLRD